MNRRAVLCALVPGLAAAWLSTASSALAQGQQQPSTVKDPVCGMKIDPAKARGKAEYKGKTYYFCSDDCKGKFEKDPAKYADKDKAPKQQ